ncbi:MAG: ATP-dependent zinc metalloprotease FtsH [Planctomycetia bacterium]|nr:ATP-dependent zinc metalloprotease FtsH [Planctomycetia bacterium]
MPAKHTLPKRSADRRPPFGGSNAVWSLIAVGVAGLFALSLLTANPEVELSYSDLERLIRASARDAAGKAERDRAIEVPAVPGRPAAVYADLADVVIGAFQVSGTLREVATETKPSASAPAGGRRRFRTAKLPSENSEGQLSKLLAEHGVPFRYEEAPSPWRNWLPMLFVTGLFGVLFFLMMRRLGGAGSPMAFGRSRGKMYAQEDLGITFDDVAGIDEAVEELREVVEFLRSPEKYQVLGGHIPKGVLLVGPPGTGKTLLAKAIAGEAGVPFFGLSGSDFVEMFVGVGAARVRDMFQQAEAKAPCIIFIDELDALGKTRGTSVVGGHDEREQTLNALLVEMDGFGSNSGVIVMAATNRPETLDPALLRPGRFDRHVLVDRPDVRGREAILKVHVADVKLNPSVNLEQVARITSGFCGADLANLVNEAALLAARNNKTSVGMEEFNEGVERVTAGLEKKKRVIHEDEKKRVAYHEAAHALVAFSLPNTDPVHKVSIIPRGLAALGYTMQRPEDDRYLMTQSELESRIQVLLAGTIAEEMVYADVSTGAQNDLERASEIARAMVMDYGMSRLGRVTYRESPRSPFLAAAGADLPAARSHSEQTAREIDEQVRGIIDRSIEEVRRILETRRAALEAVTRRLIESEVIDGGELRAIVESATASPQLVPGTDAGCRVARATPDAAEPLRPAGDMAE